jgi:hypothetical protein
LMLPSGDGRENELVGDHPEKVALSVDEKWELVNPPSVSGSGTHRCHPSTSG